MTTKRAQEILTETEKRQRKPDGTIYQTSHKHGIETRHANGGLCSTSTGEGRADAQRIFEHSCTIPNAEVVLYTRRAKGAFGLLAHN